MRKFVRQLVVGNPAVYAFEICGEVSDDDMEYMSDVMNSVFDQHEEKVDLLLWFKPYDGAETGATWDIDVVKSRFRALTNVDRYVVVGAPDYANSMIDVFGKVLPVDTHTFAVNEIDQALALLKTNISESTESV